MRFSVIVSLRSHRSCALDCVRGWVTTQKLPATEYEIIAVLPVSDPDRLREPIAALLRPHDRLILSNAVHDVAQCVEGAAAARGDYLLFTESHAWPERDVLLEILAEFERNPNWTAISGGTISVAPTRLSRAEADHYNRDIHNAMTGHPWRKVLNQIFITRRQAYIDAGGYDPELQHFAEWELAARYFDRGFEIGFAPHITIFHHSAGNIAELSEFTRSFVSGEIEFFARGRATASVIWSQIPPEWATRGALNHRLTHALAACMRKALLTWPRPALLPTVLRESMVWSMLATGGARLALGAAEWRVKLDRLLLAATVVAGSRAMSSQRFTAWVAAVIHLHRLNEIVMRLAAPLPVDDSSEMLAADDRDAGRMVGFHLLESYQSVPMRWSGPAAMVELQLGCGQKRITIDCAPVRSPLSRVKPAFFIDEKPVPNDLLSYSGHGAVIALQERPPGRLRLAWVCEPFAATHDTRRLGLPVTRIAVTGD
jgi:Glycosyl transferase family 2